MEKGKKNSGAMGSTCEAVKQSNEEYRPDIATHIARYYPPINIIGLFLRLLSVSMPTELERQPITGQYMDIKQRSVYQHGGDASSSQLH